MAPESDLQLRPLVLTGALSLVTMPLTAMWFLIVGVGVVLTSAELERAGSSASLSIRSAI